jgi:tight adherence protein C
MAGSVAGVLSLAAAMALITHLVVGHRRLAGVEHVAPDVVADTTDVDAPPVSAAERLRRRQFVAVGSAGVLSLMLAISAPTPSSLLAAVVLVAAAWYLPEVVASRQEARRRIAVDHELVDAMGEMVMAVEAGLSLDSAMARYARDRSTPLATEFGHYLDQVRLGRPRDEALDDLVERTPTGVVHLFVAAATQNQRLGTPLAAVLREQASTARRQRRQAFEEQAAKVPLKMVFPTVFCVLPVLMIVAVGPAALRLVQTLPG